MKRYTDALLRHVMALLCGEFDDKESGLPIEAHIAWNALTLLEFRLEDDGETQQEF